jgi:hypothetical protein
MNRRPTVETDGFVAAWPPELDGQVAGVLAVSVTPRFAEPDKFPRITALAVNPSVQRVGTWRRR